MDSKGDRSMTREETAQFQISVALSEHVKTTPDKRMAFDINYDGSVSEIADPVGNLMDFANGGTEYSAIVFSVVLGEVDPKDLAASMIAIGSKRMGATGHKPSMYFMIAGKGDDARKMFGDDEVRAFVRTFVENGGLSAVGFEPGPGEPFHGSYIGKVFAGALSGFLDVSEDGEIDFDPLRLLAAETRFVKSAVSSLADLVGRPVRAES